MPANQPRLQAEPAPHFQAVLFDLDGLLTSTTALHAACWQQALDEVLAEWERRTGTSPEPFDPDREYAELLDGKPRYDGVRDFLRARGIDASAGHPGSPPDEWSVHGIGSRKQQLVERALTAGGVQAYPGSIRWVRDLRARGVHTAVVSSSRNCDDVLVAAGIRDLFETTVDGRYIERLGLPGNPAPDSLLEAAARLGVAPERAIVVEDAISGVSAGRRGGFGLVIGVARTASAVELRMAGADLVVEDLEEMI